jgi:HAE1 family hydrophobic/amphiphilic exporter-1
MAIVLLIGSLFLVPKIGFSFMSSEEEKMIVPTYQPGPGQTEEQVKKIAEKAEQYFMDKKDVKLVQYSVGGENPMDPSATNQAAFYVEYKKNTKDFEKEKEKVEKDLEKISSKGEWGFQNASSSGTNNSVTLYVYGEDKQEVEPIVEDVVKILKKQDKSFKNVKSSLSDSFDEYRLVINQEKASTLGLTAAQIGMAMSNTGEAPVLTTVKKDGKDVNVYVNVEKTTYQTIDDVTNKTIKNPMGMDISIKDVVTVEKGTASDTITKRDGKYYAEVSADIKAKNVSKASSDLQKAIDKLSLPSTASVDMGGVTEDMNESFMQLGLAIAAAVAVVYLVLVITFGGGLAPFAILFSLPFTVIGALVGLLIAGETIGVSSLIGVLMLIGIVVTNAIVLVDRVIHKENEGLTTREALLEAATTRLRPILMTALATIGALIPLAIGMEGGGLISKGLGVTVIGGLTSSTLLTLVVVPIVYETLMTIKKWIRSKSKKKTEE